MKKNVKMLIAAVLSVQLALQAAAIGMTAFAEDPATPALTDVTSDSSSDSISLSGAPNVPNSIKKGGAVTVRGTVTSGSSNLTSVTAGVYNASGQFVTGKTVNPAAKSYDLKALDRYITFNTLADGEYTFAIIASNSTKSNLGLLSKKFTVGNGAAAAAASGNVTISGETKIPETLKKGQAVTIRGTVTADSNITEVAVGVYDGSGSRVTGGSATPNAKTYNLNGLDNVVAFNKLADGSYTYKVTVKTANGTTELSKQSFTIGNASTTTQTSDSDDALTISGGTVIPDTLTQGKAITVTGTVKSANSNMTALTCGVYDSNNKLVLGKTVNPRSKTYDLNSLDYVMAFNKLTAGTYTYVVSASNAGNAAYTLVSKTFKVGEGSSSTTTDNSNASVSISGGTNVPATLKSGGAVNVTGIVTSDSNMTSLTVGVYDSSNNLCTGKTVNPGAKTYDLKNLDNFVSFNKLAAGNYTYAVIVSNATATNYSLVSKSFTVGGSSSSSNSGNSGGLTISGGTDVPATITPGKAINITGVVNSESAMTALTCGVYSSAGKFVTGRTINPKAKSYDLKKFDSYVAFNKLPAGSYTYAVIASNASAKNYTLVKKKFTVTTGGDNAAAASASSSGDSISISNSTNVPGSISKGKGMLVRGTVSSASSNLTSVTVGVYDTNGSLVTGKTVNPGAKSYNVNALDSAVRFNDLSTGTYYYRVTASNSTNSNYTIVNQKFSVQ